MTSRHIPIRSCVGCRRRRPQHELVRLAVDPAGRITPGITAGRGAYVCPDVGCLDVASRHGGRALRRTLRVNKPERAVQALEALRAELQEREKVTK